MCGILLSLKRRYPISLQLVLGKDIADYHYFESFAEEFFKETNLTSVEHFT
jgi:hypothetical protein